MEEVEYLLLPLNGSLCCNLVIFCGYLYKCINWVFNWWHNLILDPMGGGVCWKEVI